MIDWATYHVPAPSVIAQIYRYSETRLNHAPFQVCVRARAYARVCEGRREREKEREWKRREESRKYEAVRSQNI